MRDEKFNDYFIAQSEEVSPGLSAYWMVLDKNEELIKSKYSSLVNSITWSQENTRELIKTANNYDKIIVHSFFFPFIKDFLWGIRKDIQVIWMFWGGDGYSFTADERPWYLSLTWEYKKNVFRKNAGLLRRIVRNINIGRMRREKSRLTRSLIRRVDICATWVKFDYEMVRHINPKMKWTYYSYFTAAQLGLQNIKPQLLNTSKLWLGNSATDTNNHLDALYYLKQIDWQGEIVAPLSYGSVEYTKDIIEYGRQNFGNRFIPITEFMSLHRYQQYMNTCGIVWMNHIRQQAAGNTLAALYMGKAVIMNNENNLYKTLIEWGVYFVEKNILKNLSELNGGLLNNNKTIIEKHLSRDENLFAIKKIYSS